jgi:hypothetical protein
MISAVKEQIQQRFTALAQRDFARLYASYHPLAPFRAQFPSAADYLAFAAETLGRIEVIETGIGAGRVSAEGVEIICALHFALDGDLQRLFELALFMETPAGWRYHSAQKLTTEEYAGAFSALDFSYFDQQPVKIRF